MKVTKNALEILKYRYLMKGETVQDMMERVSLTASNVEKEEGRTFWYDRFLSMLVNLEFIPNTPMLINAGKEQGQLSACFVLGMEDNTKSIFNTLRDTAIVHKTGGGTGFDWSVLRPEGNEVSQSTGTASGPISFMRVFNAATREMKQGGVRRGANMGVLRVDHPDIMKFIKCKEVEGDLANFNISVGITDHFMKCLYEKKLFELKFDGKV